MLGPVRVRQVAGMCGRYVWQVCAGVSWVSGVVAVDSAGVRGCRSTPARST